MINLTTDGNEISCNNDSCGGIVGSMSSLLLQASNSAKVGGRGEVGGLIGKMSGISHIIDSQNNGIVEGGEEYVGGAIGRIKSEATLVSGVENSALVQKDLSGRARYFGGLIGGVADSSNTSKFVRVFK